MFSELQSIALNRSYKGVRRGKISKKVTAKKFTLVDRKFNKGSKRKFSY